MNRRLHDVACTVCGCVCDDLSITVQDNQIIAVEGACELARPWFLAQNTCQSPMAQIGGQSVPLDAALDHAGTILAAAQSPLIFGLSRSTTEGQRAAVALADLIQATIDTSASTGHAPSIMALQEVGESTCTLGEVRNRADLVIFWGADPLRTHPRHVERYLPRAIDRTYPKDHPERCIVVVDDHATESAQAADCFLAIPSECHWEALWVLRMLLQGREPADEALAGLPDGFPMAGLRELSAQMSHCRMGIIFFGSKLAETRLAHRTVEALLQLVTDLNRHTRFYARRLRRYGDVAGADSVLTWQTGYPFGVNFFAGFPRYNPGEFTGPEMLARGEVDACVILGSETAQDLPDAAKIHLRKIPVILLDPPGAEPIVPATVLFTTAVYGVHRPGTAYRMDEVAIPLRTMLTSDYPSDGEVLNALSDRLSGIPDSGKRTRLTEPGYLNQE